MTMQRTIIIISKSKDGRGISCSALQSPDGDLGGQGDIHKQSAGRDYIQKTGVRNRKGW